MGKKVWELLRGELFFLERETPSRTLYAKRDNLVGEGGEILGSRVVRVAFLSTDEDGVESWLAYGNTQSESCNPHAEVRVARLS